MPRNLPVVDPPLPEPTRPCFAEVADSLAGPWDLMQDLVPVQLRRVAGPQIDHAQLVWRYGRIRQIGASKTVTVPPVSISGKFIRLFLKEGSKRRILFHGYVEDAGARLDGGASVDRGDQGFTAHGLGHLLDREYIDEAMAAPVTHSPGGSAMDPILIARCPVFNMQDEIAPVVRGNRSTEIASGLGTYVFDGAGDGAVWTARQVIEYLLAFFGPRTGLTWKLTGCLASLDQIREAWSLEGRTVWNALSLLIPRDRGLLYTVQTDGKAAYIDVSTIFDAPLTAGGITLQPNPNVTDLHIDDDRHFQDVTIRIITETAYHKVALIGERIKSVFTAPVDDVVAEGFWTAAEKSAYDTALGSDPDANDVQRASDVWCNVYGKVRIKPTWDWKLFGEAVAPMLDKDGRLLYEAAGRPKSQNVFADARPICRFIPLLPDHTVYGAGQPRPPLVIVQDPDNDEYYYQVDAIGKNTSFADAEAHVTPLDRWMGVQLKAKVPHVYGKGTFDEATAGASNTSPLLDYRTIKMTVMAETDAFLRVEADTGWRKADKHKRTKVIRIPDAEFWYVAPSTIYKVEDGEPQYWHSGTTMAVIRDDSARLRALLPFYLAWFGLPRASAHLASEGIDDRLAVGHYLRNLVTAKAVKNPIDTVVTEVAWTFEPKPKTVVTTGWWDVDMREGAPSTVSRRADKSFDVRDRQAGTSARATR